MFNTFKTRVQKRAQDVKDERLRRQAIAAGKAKLEAAQNEAFENLGRQVLAKEAKAKAQAETERLEAEIARLQTERSEAQAETNEAPIFGKPPVVVPHVVAVSDS